MIVADGPLSKTLNDTVETLKSKHDNLKYYELDTNQGVGAASNYGIKKSKNELIAKMDADDISTPDRFEKQIAEFEKDKELALLGGQIEEFSDNNCVKIIIV